MNIENWTDKTAAQLSNITSGVTNIGSKAHWEGRAYAILKDIIAQIDTEIRVFDGSQFTTIQATIDDLPT